jgi:hypothetical protein
MNKDKVGELFHYPNTFLLLLLGYAKVYFHLPFRQTKEGIAQEHAIGKVPSIPDHSTISRRINRLDIKIQDKSKEFENDYLIIAIESTGIKVTNRGQWMREKWNVRKKGWIVETVLSLLNGMFDNEYVYSVRLKNMIQEMMLKASSYNKMISI